MKVYVINNIFFLEKENGIKYASLADNILIVNAFPENSSTSYILIKNLQGWDGTTVLKVTDLSNIDGICYTEDTFDYFIYNDLYRNAILNSDGSDFYYNVWIGEGNKGTKAEFLDAITIKGDKGDKGESIKFENLTEAQKQDLRGKDFKFEDFTEEQLALLSGSDATVTYTSVIAALGFTPENIENKATTLAVINDTLYPSVKLMTDQLASKEAFFTKNTAFNKNFGTAAGTVAQGNDNRILNGQTAFLWGDHNIVGYLTSFTETDPIFVASEAYGITATDKTQWNTAFGWGDHAGLYSLLGHTHSYDNYQSWNLKTNGIQRTGINSDGVLDLIAGTNVGISYGAGGAVTISATNTDTNTEYSAGTALSLLGTTFNVNLGTASTQAAYGNHLHTGVYEPTFTKNTAFNKNFGTTTGTVAEGSALSGKQDTIPYVTANDSEVVKSVTGKGVDNTDPQRPIINIPDTLLPSSEEFIFNIGDSQTFNTNQDFLKEIAIVVNGQILIYKQYSIDSLNSFTIINEVGNVNELEQGDIVKIIYIPVVNISYEEETINYLTAIQIPNDATISHKTKTGAEIWEFLDFKIKEAKLNGYWDNIDSWYPMLGATISKHSINAKDVTVGTLIFEGVWDINEDGNKGDGVGTTIAKGAFVNFNDSTSLGSSIGYTEVGNTSFLFGSRAADNSSRFALLDYNGILSLDIGTPLGEDEFTTIKARPTKGMTTISYFENTKSAYLNGILEVNGDPANFIVPDGNPYYGARNAAYFNSNIAFRYPSTHRLTSWMWHTGVPAKLNQIHQLNKDWETFLNRL